MLKEFNKILPNEKISTGLILILMEHAQRGTRFSYYILHWCLNPYFNGTCSKRAFFIRPSALICYIETFTLINAFALEKGIKIASTFDCGHTKLCGYDAVEYAKQILEKGIDVYTIHLHDNDGTGDQHRPAGSLYNGINFGEIINIFNKMNHDVYGVIEHWNNNYNALEYLRNLQN